MKLWKSKRTGILYGKERGINAYMSVEASLLLPLILFVIVFLMYLCLFWYENCYVKQVAYLSAFRASREEVPKEETAKKEAEALMKLGLVGGMEHQIEAEENLLQIKVRISSVMDFLFPELQLTEETFFTAEGEGVSYKRDPAAYIRGLRVSNLLRKRNFHGN